MKEEKLHHKMVQAVVCEILSQVGFEKTSLRALSILTDAVLSSMTEVFIFLHASVSMDSLSSLTLPSLSLLVEEYVGSCGSYRREELVSFLQYQHSITKPLKDEGKELLHLLRGDVQTVAEEKRELVDLGGEREDREDIKTNKYLDDDVREYLNTVPAKKEEAYCGSDVDNCNYNRHTRKSLSSINGSIVEVNEEKKEILKKEETRDYEYLLSKKRLSINYISYYDGGCETPLLDDLLLLSTNRKIKK